MKPSYMEWVHLRRTKGPAVRDTVDVHNRSIILGAGSSELLTSWSNFCSVCFAGSYQSRIQRVALRIVHPL